MKALREDMAVHLRGGRPIRVRWRNRTEPVIDIVDQWIVEGQWWGKERKLVFFRLRTASASMDVYFEDGAWHLAQLWD